VRLRPLHDPAVPPGLAPAAQTAAAAHPAAPPVAVEPAGPRARDAGGPPVRLPRRKRFAATARKAAPSSAVAAVFGLALTLSFPPFDVWPLSIVAPRCPC